jgi:hypothetical protein
MLKLSLALVLATAALTASAAPATSYGRVVATSGSERVIALGAKSKSINVSNGETVTITVDGQSFTWHVDTFPNETSFDLAKIAPQGVATRGVTVYVSPNPIYFGG